MSVSSVDNEWTEYQADFFRTLYRTLKAEGQASSPRGLRTLEIENFSWNIPSDIRFVNFKCRNLNVDYIKREFLWYLKGDKFDTSICEHAKMWKQFINEDGSINSNYGQYIFNDLNQFTGAAKCLEQDVDSRRSAMVILQPYHLLIPGMKEVPCTYAISFRIRNGILNMTVKMRSQDSIFGFASDLPCFSFIHEMMYQYLRSTYPMLLIGYYHHFVDSFHIYERHFKMLDQIIQWDSEYAHVPCPRITGRKEVEFLIRSDFSNIPKEYEFSTWLNTFENSDAK